MIFSHVILARDQVGIPESRISTEDSKNFTIQLLSFHACDLGDLILIHTGHNNDYAHICAIERAADGRMVFHKVTALFRDGAIAVNTRFTNQPPSVSLLLGHNKDRYHRYCWDGARWHKSMPERFVGGWVRDCDHDVSAQVTRIVPKNQSLER